MIDMIKQRKQRFISELNVLMSTERKVKVLRFFPRQRSSM